MQGFQTNLKCFYPISIFLCGLLVAGCGGGGGGGGSTPLAGEQGDSGFYLQELFYGRPVFNQDGRVGKIVNPKSLIETDPVTGLVLDGYPKPLLPGKPLKDLGSFNLSGFNFKYLPG